MTTISWFVLYGKRFFSRYCFIFILHVCYACILLTFYILHTHIKGRENLRLFVQHDIALKVPFSFFFYQNYFCNDIFSDLFTLLHREHNWFSITTFSYNLCHTWKIRLLPFTAGLQIYVIWLDYFVICAWFL